MTDTRIEEPRADVTLDCSGLLCPLPVYKASLALRQMSPGEVLHLVTTDPGALEDVPAMARQLGEVLLEVGRTETTQVFWIEKGPNP